jgi:hypothetical protein
MLGTATREHILPQWLHQHIETPGVNLKHRAVDEDGATLLRSHHLNNFAYKSICGSCNHGWMSQLEADVKPLLLPLIEAKRSANSLTTEETRIVARWAFKTSFMILSGQNSNPVPWHQFETWVAAGAGDPDPALIFALSDLQSARGFGYVAESDDMEDSPVHPVNSRVSICIGSLLLIVLLPLDDRGRAPGIGHPLYRLLWPNNVAPIKIPTEVGPNIARPFGEFIKYLAGFVYAGIPSIRSKE